jgi:type II secretory pathway component PulM
MSNGEKYLLAAYLVFLALVLVYVVIMARRLGGMEDDLAELRRLAAERERAEADREPEPVA